MANLHSPTTSLRLNRIDRVLDYIQAHISESLSVNELAEHSCWSRWQLQRVFLAETDLTVAQYVRQLRLSIAADRLLTSTSRQIDIAISCGFESEISFSRSFKQFFSCSPSQYRKKGQRTGLLLPIGKQHQTKPALDVFSQLIKVRVETKPAFELAGLSCKINGIFSASPNFNIKVPKLWQQLTAVISQREVLTQERFGVIAVSQAEVYTDNMPYWAGIVRNAVPDVTGLEVIQIPAQQYAVIECVGPITDLPKILDWFICHWLPDSDYACLEGFDLEYYGPDFDFHSDKTQMEYWLPVTRR